MKNNIVTVAALSMLAVAGAASAAPFTVGNLVTARVGAVGGPTLTSAANAVFLDEYSQTGILLQSIAMPTAASGANLPFALSGTATSEGQLNLSTDGRYLILAGYGAIPGAAAVVASAAPRVIARIDMAGNIDTSTALTDAYLTNNMRGVASVDGSAFWTSGTAAAAGNTGGVRYVASLGATTSTAVTAPGLPINTRHINIFNGQLYISSASGAAQGLLSVGTGLPTTGSTAITILPGFPGATVPSSYDFVIIENAPFLAGPATVAYVADDRTTASGGVQKWLLNGGTWSLVDTISPGVPFRHIARVNERALVGVTLTALSGSSPQAIVTISDQGSPTTPFVTPGVALGDATTRLFSRGLRQIPSNTPPCIPVVASPTAPADQPGVIEGATINLLAAVATGSAPVSFFWLKDGSPLVDGPSAIGTVAGATTSMLTITASTLLASGNYEARLFNACRPNGSVSRTAVVTVVPATPTCLADVAGNAEGGPDGIVDGNDFVAFINSFSTGDASVDPIADIAGGAEGGPDGIVDGNDFVAFINAFAAGC